MGGYDPGTARAETRPGTTATTESRPDATQKVETFPDPWPRRVGTDLVWDDGRRVERGADGTYFTRYADGTWIEARPDGTESRYLPNGTEIRITRSDSASPGLDSETATFPDGSSVEVRADGSITFNDPPPTQQAQGPPAVFPGGIAPDPAPDVDVPGLEDNYNAPPVDQVM